LSRFSFEGFLPRTASARKDFFTAKLADSSTWAFYESSHRILDALHDMAEIYPEDHDVVIARELTKLHETIVKGRLADVLHRVTNDANMRKGEFVVIVAGCEQPKDTALTDEQQRILKILLRECSTKTAAALAADITGQRRKLLYQAALDMQGDQAAVQE